MNPFTFAVLAAASLFVAQRSHAADLPVKYDHVEYKQTGNTYKWQPLHGATPGGNGITFRGPTGIDTVQPKINTLERLPYDKRGTVPPSQMAKVSSPFTKKAFGSALMLAGRASWPIGVVLTAGELYDYFLEEGVFDIKNTPDGITGKVVRKTIQDFPQDGLYYISGEPDDNKFGPTPAQACISQAPAYVAASWSGFSLVSASLQGTKCAVTLLQNAPNSDPYTTLLNINFSAKPCPPNSTPKAPNLCTVTSGTVQELNQTELEDYIASKSGWPTSAARALQSALNTPGVTIQTEPPAVTGPSSIPGSTTTTTTKTQVAPGTTTPVAPGTPGAQPATSTTTTTTTTNNKYEGSSVTNNTTTTTVTNITNNVTNQTTKDTPDEKKEEETKEDDNEDETPTNKDLGDIPELYERKYPDGLSGIWNTKSAEIKQTPLFTLPTLLMPTGLSSGTCPSWQIDLSFGGAWGDYGSQDVSPPCWIWDIARVIIIASALILARALVFGG